MLQINTPAPDFHLPDQNAEMHALKDYAGKKLAIYFYPKDDTPGCTEQACNLRDNMGALKAAGIAVLGVSVDTLRKHKNFEKKYTLPFPLLADTEHRMVEAYEVWGEKTMFGRKYMGTHRITFLIDEKGIITHIIDKVDTKDHAGQILKIVKREE